LVIRLLKNNEQEGFGGDWESRRHHQHYAPALNAIEPQFDEIRRFHQLLEKRPPWQVVGEMAI